MDREGMMKIFLALIAAFFLIAAPCQAQEIDRDSLLVEPMPGSDVRWFIWGVPPEDVIQYEKVVLFEQVGDTLFFVDEINSIKTLISYEFIDNKLWRVTYDMQKDTYPDPQEVIDDFVRFDIMLSKRYGESTGKDLIWKDDYYKDKPNRWGLAIFNSLLEMRMVWDTPRTRAFMSLKAVDHDYQFRVVHTSAEIADQIERAKMQEHLSIPQ